MMHYKHALKLSRHYVINKLYVLKWARRQNALYAAFCVKKGSSDGASENAAMLFI